MAIGPGNDIIIIPGQSNSMDNGWGSYTSLSTEQDGNINQVGRDGATNMTIIAMGSVLEFWVEAGYHGSGYSIARWWALNNLESGRKIIVVPAAKGGTSILEWLDLVTPSVPLWSDMVSRVNLAMSQSGTNRIIWWAEHQGEQDMAIASNPGNAWYSLMPDATTYQARKLDLIDRVRSTFGTFPMTFGKYSQAWAPGGGTTMKAQFEAAIANASAARSMCKPVETYGCPDNSSVDPVNGLTIHFDAQAQETLAQRHYNAMLALLGTQSRQYALGGVVPLIVNDYATRQYVTPTAMLDERATSPVSADDPSGAEIATSTQKDGLAPAALAGSPQRDTIAPIDAAALTRLDDLQPLDVLATLRQDRLAPAEFANQIARDAVAPIAPGAAAAFDVAAPVDTLSLLQRDALALVEPQTSPSRADILAALAAAASLARDVVGACDPLSTLRVDAITAVEAASSVPRVELLSVAEFATSPLRDGGVAALDVEQSSALHMLPPVQILGAPSATLRASFETVAAFSFDSAGAMETAASARPALRAPVDVSSLAGARATEVLEIAGSAAGLVHAPAEFGAAASAHAVGPIGTIASLSGRGLDSAEILSSLTVDALAAAEPGRAVLSEAVPAAAWSASATIARTAATEILATALSVLHGQCETAAGAGTAARGALEDGVALASDLFSPAQALAASGALSRALLEWSGSLSIVADVLLPLDMGSAARSSARSTVETSSAIVGAGHGALENLAAAGRDAPYSADWVASLRAEGVSAAAWSTSIAGEDVGRFEFGQGAFARSSAPIAVAGSVAAELRAAAEWIALVQVLFPMLAEPAQTASALAAFAAELAGAVQRDELERLDWTGIVLLFAHADYTVLARVRRLSFLAAPRRRMIVSAARCGVLFAR